MGKASSAKKVARAARSGGRSPREAPKLGFPLAIFAIVVLGSLLVFYARTSRESTASAEAPSYLAKDHWHAAYGFYVCDHWLPNLTDATEDKLGIHTHGEGIIHIHPFSAAASGSKAKMKLFMDQVGVKLSDDGWTMPDGTEYKAGYDCGGKPGKFAVYRFAADDPNGVGEVFENNVNNIAFRGDRDVYVFAILPEGAEPPPLPASVAELDNLTDVAQDGSTGGATTGDPTTGGATTGGVTDSTVTIPSDVTLVPPTTVAGTPTGSTP